MLWISQFRAVFRVCSLRQPKVQTKLLSNLVWGSNTNVHISVLDPHCALVTHLWIRPFERRVNIGCIRALTWKEMDIMLEPDDGSAWCDPTHTCIIGIRWRADFLLISLASTCRWVLNQCFTWLQCTSAWVNSQCLMLLAKQTVLSPCSPPPSLTYTSNTKEPASLCQETLAQAPYPLLIIYSFTKSNAITRLLSENEICSQCGSFLMEMIKWEMIWIYE